SGKTGNFCLISADACLPSLTSSARLYLFCGGMILMLWANTASGCTDNSRAQITPPIFLLIKRSLLIFFLTSSINKFSPDKISRIKRLVSLFVHKSATDVPRRNYYVSSGPWRMPDRDEETDNQLVLVSHWFPQVYLIAERLELIGLP